MLTSETLASAILQVKIEIAAQVLKISVEGYAHSVGPGILAQMVKDLKALQEMVTEDKT